MRNDLKKIIDKIKTKKTHYRCQTCGELFALDIPETVSEEDVSVRVKCSICETESAFKIVVTDPRILGQCEQE